MVSLEDTSQLWCVLESSGSLSRMEALCVCSLRFVIFNSNKYSESFAYEYYGSELLSSDLVNQIFNPLESCEELQK